MFHNKPFNRKKREKKGEDGIIGRRKTFEKEGLREEDILCVLGWW